MTVEKPMCLPPFDAAPFKPSPGCMDCLAGLAQSAGAMVSGDDSDMILRATRMAEGILETVCDRPISSPEIANRILRSIRAMSGVEDPYTAFKAREMAHAREILSRIGPLEGLGLRPLVQLAALGNSLDFFTDPGEALAQVPETFLRGITFFRDDISALDHLLSVAPGLVLYLTDNSGEVFFDLPLYEHIASRVGRTVMVVKGGPALNDLTRSELNSQGLGDRIKDIADTGHGRGGDRLGKRLAGVSAAAVRGRPCGLERDGQFRDPLPQGRWPSGLLYLQVEVPAGPGIHPGPTRQLYGDS